MSHVSLKRVVSSERARSETGAGSGPGTTEVSKPESNGVGEYEDGGELGASMGSEDGACDMAICWGPILRFSVKGRYLYVVCRYICGANKLR